MVNDRNARGVIQLGCDSLSSSPSLLNQESSLKNTTKPSGVVQQELRVVGANAMAVPAEHRSDRVLDDIPLGGVAAATHFRFSDDGSVTLIGAVDNAPKGLATVGRLVHKPGKGLAHERLLSTREQLLDLALDKKGTRAVAILGRNEFELSRIVTLSLTERNAEPQSLEGSLTRKSFHFNDKFVAVLDRNGDRLLIAVGNEIEIFEVFHKKGDRSVAKKLIAFKTDTSVVGATFLGERSNGELFVGIATDSNQLQIWSVAANQGFSKHFGTGSKAIKVEQHITSSQVTAMNLSSSGAFIAAGHEDGAVSLWSQTEAGRLKLCCSAKGENPIHSVSPAADGSGVVAADVTGKVYIFDSNNELPLMRRLGAQFETVHIGSVAYSPRQLIYVGSIDSFSNGLLGSAYQGRTRIYG